MQDLHREESIFLSRSQIGSDFLYFLSLYSLPGLSTMQKPVIDMKSVVMTTEMIVKWTSPKGEICKERKKHDKYYFRMCIKLCICYTLKFWNYSTNIKSVHQKQYLLSITFYTFNLISKANTWLWNQCDFISKFMNIYDNMRVRKQSIKPLPSHIQIFLYIFAEFLWFNYYISKCHP